MRTGIRGMRALHLFMVIVTASGCFNPSANMQVVALISIVLE